MGRVWLFGCQHLCDHIAAAYNSPVMHINVVAPTAGPRPPWRSGIPFPIAFCFFFNFTKNNFSSKRRVSIRRFIDALRLLAMTWPILLHSAYFASSLFMGNASYNTSRIPQLVFGGSRLAQPTIRIGASLQIDCCSSQSSRAKEMLHSWQLGIQFFNQVAGGLDVSGVRHQVMP